MLTLAGLLVVDLGAGEADREGADRGGSSRSDADSNERYYRWSVPSYRPTPCPKAEN